MGGGWNIVKNDGGAQMVVDPLLQYFALCYQNVGLIWIYAVTQQWIDGIA